MVNKSPKKNKFDPSRYEGYRYGPIRLERFGRVVRITSQWGPGQFERYREEIRSKRPDLKKTIDTKITELLSLTDQFDPLQLLATVSAKNCFFDPETYKETTHEGKECYVEYAQSLVVARKRNPAVKDATKESIERFNTLIAEIFRDVMWYFGTEVTEGKRNELEEEIRFTSLLRYLFVRGDSFPEHHLEMINDTFKQHASFLKERCGFTLNEVLVAIQNIEQQVLDNFRQHSELISVLRDLHELFRKFVDQEGTNTFSSEEDLRERYHSLPAVRAKMVELNNLQNAVNKNPFEVISNKDVPLELLRMLSSTFGDNSAFVAFPSSPGWPTNNSIIYERPLILDDGRFYCFIPQVAFRNLGNILERWIQKVDNQYYQNAYQKSRALYLESKALEYLGNILPKAQVLGKVYYQVKTATKTERVETDGLILYDENLFIIEAKAGALSVSARRGSLEQTRRDITELVDNAYKQALRTKQYIMETAEPTFEFANGSEAIVIRDKTIYRNIYLVNVTLQNLGPLATQLNSLKAWNLLLGKEWPWSVFINDLRIISELIEFPSEFLHFLQHRIRANDYPQFQTTDELDLFMFYLREGLYLEDMNLADITNYGPHGYTERLDRWYDYLAGRVSSGTKPQLRIADGFKDLIAGIESAAKPRFTKIATTLLTVDRQTQRTILDNLKLAEAESSKDRKDHDFTMYFKKANMGLMFSVSTRRSADFWQKIDNHCRLKMYQTRLEEWFFITVDVQENGKRVLDFRIYSQRWKYDPAMEEQLKKFKEWKWNQLKKTQKEVGKNEPCPCGSGLKYKRCCGR